MWLIVCDLTVYYNINLSSFDPHAHWETHSAHNSLLNSPSSVQLCLVGRGAQTLALVHTPENTPTGKKNLSHWKVTLAPSVVLE